MRKEFLLIISLFFAFVHANAGDITVSGDVSGTWTKGSTVTVTDHITIPAGESLTIEEGVNVYMADTAKHIEFLVLGNLYCKGTETAPINITVKPGLENQTVDFPRSWGGIICDTTCSEFLMLYTHVEYTGAVTTEESPSVKKGLYKASAGEGLPIINFRNPDNGKLVIMHSTFNNAGEDGMYLEGGKYIIAYNTLYTTGATGGDMINLKAGSVADICFNLEYSPNTNGLKLSNSGERNPQCNPVCYNNTIVNSGWRRPTVKGGGIWLEKGVNAHIFNNMLINPRFAVKNSEADAASEYDYQYYYGYDQETVDQFQADIADNVRGAHDIGGTVAGENDPLFENYDLSNDKFNTIYNTDWDFHLKSGSPAIGAGTTDFTRHFGTTGITLGGVMYTSPDPSTTIGAFEASDLTSVSPVEKMDDFNVYPNPANTNLNIRFNAKSNQSNIKVYSTTGQLLLSKNVENNIGETVISLQLENLNSGMYFISVLNGNRNLTKSVIKQ